MAKQPEKPEEKDKKYEKPPIVDYYEAISGLHDRIEKRSQQIEEASSKDKHKQDTRRSKTDRV